MLALRQAEDQAAGSGESQGKRSRRLGRPKNSYELGLPFSLPLPSVFRRLQWDLRLGFGGLRYQ